MPATIIADLDAARLRKHARAQAPERTVILQASNIRSDGEVHRHLGVNSALTLTELHRILCTCFGLPGQAPWHFFEHSAARGRRINPAHAIGHFLHHAGDTVDYTWGLWDFSLLVAHTYPRDAGTPQALCVGGSGSFGESFDITAINAALTGQDITDNVLAAAHADVREVVQRSKLFDFVPLLQAVDLTRATAALPGAAALPREVTMQARDAFWSYILALTCMGDNELTASVLEATMEALGWTADDGQPQTAAEILALIPDSVAALQDIGACGPQQKAPVDRLDIYRALLRAEFPPAHPLTPTVPGE